MVFNAVLAAGGSDGDHVPGAEFVRVSGTFVAQGSVYEEGADCELCGARGRGVDCEAGVVFCFI